MAVGTPVQRGNGGGSTSATTGSFTPNANTKLFAFVTGFRSTVLPADPTVSDSVGLTWTQIGSVNYDPGANRRMKSRLFVATVGGSPSAMTVTGSCSDGTETTITVCDVTGVGEIYSNVITGTNSAGDPSGTLSAFSTGGIGIAWAAMQGSGASTQPSGYTEIYDATITANGQSRRNTTAYDLASPGTALSFTSTNTYSTMIGLELRPGVTMATSSGSFALTGSDATLTVTVPPYYANAVEFDGVNDYLSKASGISAATASTLSASIWIYLDTDSEAGGYYPLLIGSGSGETVNFYFYQDTTWVFSMEGRGAGGTAGFGVFQDGFTLPSGWVNILVSRDTNYSAGNKVYHLYFNDVAASSPALDDSDGAYSTDFSTITNWTIGEDGGSLFNGRLAEFWVSTELIDFSVTANRRKFIDASGKPVSLGNDGSLPTGTAPAIYLKGDYTSFGTNSGTGGDFTVTGALTAVTGPSGIAPLQAGGGTFSLTGTAATLKRALKLTASGAAYTLSGTAASLDRGLRVTASSGSFAFTGTAAALKRGLKISAAGASYALTGGDASFGVGTFFSVDGGSFALTGSDATFRRSLVLAAASGTFTLTGTSATFTRSRVFAADGGSYSVSGSDAALKASRKITATGTSFTLSGSAASFSKALRLAAASGAYAMTGADATLTPVFNGLPVKIGVGGEWVEGRARIYDGGEWVTPTVKRYDEGVWVDL